MNNLSVTCLQLSYGRPQLSIEAVECFLRQTYENKKLIIINTHPSPIYFDKRYDNIEIHNIKPLPYLSDIYRFGMDLITSDYFCIWDDDDLFMPWHIEDRINCVKNHIEYTAVGHKVGFFSVNNSIDNMGGNMFVSQYLYKNNGIRPDPKLSCWDTNWHNKNWNWYHMDFPTKPSYIYRWGTGEDHLSGFGGDEINIHKSYLRNMEIKHKLVFDFPWIPKWNKDYCLMVNQFLHEKNI